MSILTLVRSRAFAALVVVAAAALLAAACNGDGGGKTPAAGGQTPVATETPTDAETPPVGDTPDAGAETASIQMVSGPAFSTSELVVAAGTDVEITAENTDGFHSFAVYESEADAEGGGEPIAETEACSSPCTDSVTVNLAAGEHFFRCEVHPGLMTGTLVAQ